MVPCMSVADQHRRRQKNEVSSVSTEAVQDYAKAIYALEQQGSEWVSTTSLSERLAVSPASVTAMIQKMAGLKFVSYKPYSGVQLTKTGKKLALEMVRHHRLLEQFLSEALDMPWDQVHREAEILEHVISEDMEARIDEKLGHPKVDPHGDPIPSLDGSVDEPETVRLDEVEVGRSGVLVRVSDSNPEILRYLEERKIKPGLEFRLSNREPFGGPLTLSFGEEKQTISPELACAIRVKIDLDNDD